MIEGGPFVTRVFEQPPRVEGGHHRGFGRVAPDAGSVFSEEHLSRDSAERKHRAWADRLNQAEQLRATRVHLGGGRLEAAGAKQSGNHVKGVRLPVEDPLGHVVQHLPLGRRQGGFQELNLGRRRVSDDEHIGASAANPDHEPFST